MSQSDYYCFGKVLHYQLVTWLDAAYLPNRQKIFRNKNMILRKDKSSDVAYQKIAMYTC